MSINFDEKFLDWAVQLEDESNCDVSAGRDLGKDVDQYLEYVLSCKLTNYSKVLNLLQQKLSTTLPQNEIEALASQCLEIVLNEPDKSIAA